MIKKKPQYKEDHIKNQVEQSKNTKQTNNLCIITPEDQSNVTVRGRQLSGKVSPVHKKDDSTTCERKGRVLNRDKESFKKIKQIKSKGIEYQLNEEYESSDSSNSLKRKNKTLRREFYEKEAYVNKNLPMQKKIIENSPDISSDEIDQGFVLTYQDNLINEIERILIEMINNNIDKSNKNHNSIVAKYENHVR